MQTYTIRPFHIGTITHYRGTFSSDPEQYKTRETFPILVYLIEGNGKKILVDTGAGNPDEKTIQIPPYRPEHWTPELSADHVLRSGGVEPAEIDIVVQTHLHWDHCYNNHLFPQADFYVQYAEMVNALRPLPAFAVMYESFSLGSVPPWARHSTKWRFVEGDYDLMEGIRLVFIPGHSPGLMGVWVQTEKGPYFIASDAVPLYDNILPDGGLGLNGICDNLRQHYRSLGKIKALKAVLLPSHDFLVLRHKCYPI